MYSGTDLMKTKLHKILYHWILKKKRDRYVSSLRVSILLLSS